MYDKFSKSIDYMIVKFFNPEIFNPAFNSSQSKLSKDLSYAIVTMCTIAQPY